MYSNKIHFAYFFVSRFFFSFLPIFSNLEMTSSFIVRRSKKQIVANSQADYSASASDPRAFEASSPHVIYILCSCGSFGFLPLCRGSFQLLTSYCGRSLELSFYLSPLFFISAQSLINCFSS